ncbi:hypothetical protein [Phaeobacter porticola]|uniref:Uncharacterized protein n=1 Tax=Phaeobacter porticola TaxID=1844006 RepID=A0A1L3I6S6_9RHOB|nr:hypothetical protein [Phaeobacter porticola]APG47741.1 hypothetical protein PhaeoP97_02347 [Phaeobacter porticola]
MKSKSRFIKSIVAAAKTEEVHLPWTRGTQRKTALLIRHNTAPRQVQAKSA